MTITSASSSVPDVNRTPFGVNRSMESVTTDARPEMMTLRRSQALIPRLRRVEVDVDVDVEVGRQQLGVGLADDAAHLRRLALGELVRFGRQTGDC